MYAPPVVTSKLPSVSPSPPRPPRIRQHSPSWLLQNSELGNPLALLVYIQNDGRAQTHGRHHRVIRGTVFVGHDSLAGAVFVDEDVVGSVVRRVVPHAERLHPRDEGFEERRERRREKCIAGAERAGMCLQTAVCQDSPFRLRLREDARQQRGFFADADERRDVADRRGDARDGRGGEGGARGRHRDGRRKGAARRMSLRGFRSH